MTKRDTIILAVLFNVVILACLLATAQQVTAPKEPVVAQEETKPAVVQVLPPKTEEKDPVAFDEIDHLLEEYITSKEPKVQEKPQAVSQKESVPSDFYIVRSGDNPWTISKKFGISFERLLAINNLDEASARNLKIGQTLRIREAA